MRFKNKIVLITGASKGIGSEAVKLFAKEGAKVVINYFSNKELANKLLEEINNNGIIIKADISNPYDINNMFDIIYEKYGKLDILVNNAGIVAINSFVDLSIEQWDKTFNTNVRGVFLCSQKAVKLMGKGSSILNISSIRGLFNNGRILSMDYSSTKAAIINFTKTLAKELSPNIRVNTIAPGVTKTSMISSLGEEFIENSLKEVYQNRILEPKEIANAIIFLSSNDASAITGTILVVDGGQSLN